MANAPTPAVVTPSSGLVAPASTAGMTSPATVVPSAPVSVAPASPAQPPAAVGPEVPKAVGDIVVGQGGVTAHSIRELLDGVVRAAVNDVRSMDVSCSEAPSAPAAVHPVNDTAMVDATKAVPSRSGVDGRVEPSMQLNHRPVVTFAPSSGSSSQPRMPRPVTRGGRGGSSSSRETLPRPVRSARLNRPRPQSARMSIGARGNTGAAVAQAELQVGGDDANVTVEEPDAEEEVDASAPTPAANTRSRRAAAAPPSGHNINVTLNVSQAPSSSSGHVVSGSDASRPSVPPTPTPSLPAPPAGAAPADSTAAAAPVPSTAPTVEAAVVEPSHETTAAGQVEPAARPPSPETSSHGSFVRAVSARQVGAVGSDILREATRRAQVRLASEREGAASAPPPQRRRLVPAQAEPALTVGRPATNEGALPELELLAGWSVHRRLHVRWDDSVSHLVGFVGEVRRVTGVLNSLGTMPLATEIRTQFLARLERNFQVPNTIRCDRVMVPNDDEAMYVASMHRWLTTRREGVLANALPPINAPATWHVPDVRPFTVRPGEPESETYRSLRLEFILTSTSGRYISFDEFDLFRRDREPARRYLLEGLTSPEAIGSQLHADLRGFPALPDVVLNHMPARGLAVPRLRSWFYFGDVVEVPEAYGLDDIRELEVFCQNLDQAV